MYKLLKKNDKKEYVNSVKLQIMQVKNREEILFILPKWMKIV